jgi:hypothetical protein
LRGVQTLWTSRELEAVILAIPDGEEVSRPGLWCSRPLFVSLSDLYRRDLIPFPFSGRYQSTLVVQESI